MTEMHRLLQRQLKKLGFTADGLPQNLESWTQFIAHINKTYYENDQDRYLLERSIDISSKEMRDINSKLEYAQDIAQMGYWHYDADTDTATWSKGLFKILGLPPSNVALNYSSFLDLVHPNDKAGLKNVVEKALKEKEDYDYELRVRNGDNDYKWYRTIARANPHKNEISGVLMDISKRKIIEEQVHELNNKLVSTARLAGMSEVATSILHNVGNILNSVNVSAIILKKNISNIHYKKLSAIKTMLDENINQLSEYLLQNPKGKLILPYLDALSKTLHEEYEENMKEANSLETNINHIKEIIAMQQSLSGLSNLTEKISIHDVILNAVKSVILDKHQIDVRIEIEPDINEFITDKSKLFQILTNLLANAKDSVLLHEANDSRKIVISIGRTEKNHIMIKINDNGIGIQKDNLDRIFSFGFTTKKNGHGFGLHCSAIYARDLGGTLYAESNGNGKGDQFVLDLPINPKTLSTR
ncbi:TPA: PAS domain-containing protein [Legionella pneumophila subsp. pneumophila]|uniref:NosP-associated histidine kinase NahK n=1 Tax=Legionella pneumophila TaxID=446 RepID=UPI0005913907|nr:NosP-associated histidine kinase NahK [Legionella pneumophila]HAT8927772.1 PAS domain-containing protein [Legionella pneumophila subsp. pneumophila]HAT8930816.1 PAS domain-containing protein [Legionella pneumophila subsp. pneumophila]HAT9964117.1 PAS domain-containing protein [Legionella pneumophila subsp. pneumophila]HAT9982197.1 PAS domain-containing protein [Legionella pneumophila subsp. pneumophila]